MQIATRITRSSVLIDFSFFSSYNYISNLLIGAQYTPPIYLIVTCMHAYLLTDVYHDENEESRINDVNFT